MKRLLFMSFLALLLLSSVDGFTGERFMISVSGNYLLPSDKNFKDIYGKGFFYPGLKAGFKVFKGLYLWAGYGFFSARGTTAVLEQEAKSSQKFLSGGAGYMIDITKKFVFKVEVGLFYASCNEESMGEEVSDSALGFRINGAVIFYLNRVFFVVISPGYLKASGTIENVPVKLGGFRTGIGLGLRF